MYWAAERVLDDILLRPIEQIVRSPQFRMIRGKDALATQVGEER